MGRSRIYTLETVTIVWWIGAIVLKEIVPRHLQDDWGERIVFYSVAFLPFVALKVWRRRSGTKPR